MKFYSISKSTSLFLAGLFMFGTTMATAQTKECDMPDEIAAGDSAAVRDDCPDKGEPEKKQKKQRSKSTTETTTAKPDNSRYSTDGTERYDQYDNDKGSGGTGPKREGRY